ncbi:MAG: TRAP transporter fused permease subunit [Zestosphaera sp.]
MLTPKSASSGSKVMKILHVTFCSILVLYVMWYAGAIVLRLPTVERGQGCILFLTLACIIMLFNSAMGRSNIFGLKNPLLNKLLSAVMIVLISVSGIYFFREYYAILYYRMGIGNIYDVVLGAVAVITVLECCRKNVEKIITIIAIGFMVYALVGPYIPIPGLSHKGLSLWDLFRVLSADIPLGIFGSLTQVAFTWVSGFVIFASFLRALGGFDLIYSVMRYLASAGPYLVPQTGVIASALFGMFSGSAPANVAGTGVFTISMNKRIGIPAKFAAAIEAVASSGGLIVPPVMGAVAFIMAALLGIQYLFICAVAVVPAVMYYLSASVATFLYTRRHLDLRKAYKVIDEMPHTSAKSIAIAGVPFVTALAVLVFLMAYTRLDPLLACFYAVTIYVPFAFIYNYIFVWRQSKKSGFREYVMDFGGRVTNAIVEGGEVAATLGITLATVSIITCVLSVTGTVVKWSMYLTHAVGDNLALLVLVAWLIATLLGFGVSTSGVYVITTAIVAPAFVRLNVPLLITHFFVFWVATLSAITPPVAIAAATAAKIAEERYITVAIESMKLGLPLFLICFAFFVWPELLIWSPATLIAILMLASITISMPVGIYGSKVLEMAVRSRGIYILLRLYVIISSLLVAVGRSFIPDYMLYLLAGLTVLITLYTLIQEVRNYRREITALKNV